MPDALLNRLIGSAYARLNADARVRVADLTARNFEEITYARIAALGYRPDGFIDVGAYKGDWTKLARQSLGDRPALMVEAQAGLVPALQAQADADPQLHLAHAILSREGGQEVQFHEMGTGSSLFGEASNAPRTTVTGTTRTLDAVAADFVRDKASVFLKIDVQGAELEVLGGGAATLAKASLVQLELAMLPYNKGAPLMPEVVAWMAAQGWLPTEISGFSRPSGPLVQIDMLFARAGSVLRPEDFRF